MQIRALNFCFSLGEGGLLTPSSNLIGTVLGPADEQRLGQFRLAVEGKGISNAGEALSKRMRISIFGEVLAEAEVCAVARTDRWRFGLALGRGRHRDPRTALRRRCPRR